MKSLIFQGWGVRAILENRKTMTRRIMKPQPPFYIDKIEDTGLLSIYTDGEIDYKPQFQIGEVIYVKET